MHVGDRRSDAELVAGTLRGDRGAFDEMVRRYHRLLYSVVYRIMGNQTDADDLVQAIFLRAYRGLASFEPDSDLKNWLYAIAVNTSLNARKQMQRQRDLVARAAAGRALRVEAAGDRRVAVSELQEELDRAIAQLPDEQRVVLTLRIRDGLSHEEIGKIFKCPPATIASRLFLARKKLETLLREHLNT